MSSSWVYLPEHDLKFIAASHESILHAGLASGINLNYGCAGGNCGDCKARLLAGSITVQRHTDFPFTEVEKSEGLFLMCRNLAMGDIEIGTRLRDRAEVLSYQEIEAKVYQIQSLTDEVLAVSFRTPRSQPLKFFAGQFIKVDFGQGITRYESVVSCPCDGLKPIIHVKLESNEFSQYCYERLKKHDNVTISGPDGRFVFNEGNIRPKIFISFDMGFASINSLIEQFINLETEQAIEIYRFASSRGQTYLDNYCRSLVDAFDNIEYELHIVGKNALKDLSTVIGRSKILLHSELFISVPEIWHEHISNQLYQYGVEKTVIKYNDTPESG
jgi:CDP-4-dehydro-6-deoxyglucose reductase, E3